MNSGLKALSHSTGRMLQSFHPFAERLVAYQDASTNPHDRKWREALNLVSDDVGHMRLRAAEHLGNVGESEDRRHENGWAGGRPPARLVTRQCQCPSGLQARSRRPRQLSVRRWSTGLSGSGIVQRIGTWCPHSVSCRLALAFGSPFHVLQSVESARALALANPGFEYAERRCPVKDKTRQAGYRCGWVRVTKRAAGRPAPHHRRGRWATGFLCESALYRDVKRG